MISLFELYYYQKCLYNTIIIKNAEFQEYEANGYRYKKITKISQVESR